MCLEPEGHCSSGRVPVRARAWATGDRGRRIPHRGSGLCGGDGVGRLSCRPPSRTRSRRSFSATATGNCRRPATRTLSTWLPSSAAPRARPTHLRWRWSQRRIVAACACRPGSMCPTGNSGKRVTQPKPNARCCPPLGHSTRPSRLSGPSSIRSWLEQRRGAGTRTMGAGRADAAWARASWDSHIGWAVGCPASAAVLTRPAGRKSSRRQHDRSEQQRRSGHQRHRAESPLPGANDQPDAYGSDAHGGEHGHGGGSRAFGLGECDDRARQRFVGPVVARPS